jgi:hypothetical protein
MKINFEKGSAYSIMLSIIVLLLIAGAIACGVIYYYSIKNPAPIPPVDNTLIKVDSPQPNQEIQSPFVVKGQAKGNWFFEATFPVKLLDENGNIIKQTFAQAQGDWMTTNFVPFESVLIFSVDKNQKGTLILEKDNPSGLPENAKEISIPVNLSATKAPVQFRAVTLYYYNSNLDKDDTGNILCSKNGLVAVDRQIPITNTPIQDTINLLISGNITAAEKAQGITTEYPLQGLKLMAASLNGSVLTLTFNDPNNKTGGGACRAGILWFQIEATAKQFIGVSSVKFMPEELFQP